MGLKKYYEKRDFGKTPEPKGREHGESHGHLFVIQKHAASRLHYDFRLELEGVLKSWAVPKGPSLDPSEKRLAVEVEDHPLEYGTFEGAIPEGEYGGGTVLLWDRGEWIPEGDAAVGYEKGRLKFRLEGEKLHGRWSLVRMGRGGKNWLLTKSKDEDARPADDGEITEERTESVLSGRVIEEITAEPGKVWGRNGAAAVKTKDATASPPKKAARAPGKKSAGAEKSSPASPEGIPGAKKAAFPQKVSAQLATLVKEAPTGEDWFHEIKFDGYRILAFVEDGQVRMMTRNDKDWSERFADLARVIGKLGVRQAVLDGEVVALNEQGRSDFQTLQNALTVSGKGLLYYAFDLLYLDGYDLRGATTADRTAALQSLLSRSNPDPERIRFSEHLEESGERVFERACSMALEGIISKRRDARYTGTRSDAWVKTKCVKRQEFVIGGYTDPMGSRIELGALLVGVRDTKGRLTYAGQVGTGFTKESLRDLGTRLRAIETGKSPFPATLKLSAREARGVHWVKPELVAEVEFTEWTKDGRLRHPSFQGLREDKPAEDVVAEQPKALRGTERKKDGAEMERQSPAKPGAGRTSRKSAGASAGNETQVAGVRLSSPDKVLYPEQGLTKLDLARHYELVADRMLPHVQGRPLVLVRCPAGARKQCFFQRHPGKSEPDGVGHISLMNEGKAEEHLAVQDLQGLIGLAQIGALEVHAWGAWPDDPESPDRMTFDLDPGTETEWKDLVEAARRVRAKLEELGLPSFVKTTGGRGLHVVVPLAKGSTWDEVEDFSRALAQSVVREDPERYIATMSKAKREGKIFIDYLRNARAASAVAPYSPRSREGATVSVPVAWEELRGKLRPDSFTVRNLPARLKRLKDDPWKDFEKARVRLTDAMREALEEKAGAAKGKK